jgi:iron(III) transport system substrate-binding protein
VRTDLVPESERPKAWSDLADPRYRGRMVMADPQASAIALAVVGALAQRLGWDFVKALRANDTMVVQGHAQLFKAMQRGERALGIGGVDPRSLSDGKEPPHQAIIVPTEGAVAVGAPVAVIKGAKNPNAARLLAQFMISTVAQRIVVDNAMHSSRADIAPPKGQPALNAVRIIPIDFDRIERDAGDIKARFSEIFR